MESPQFILKRIGTMNRSLARQRLGVRQPSGAFDYAPAPESARGLAQSKTLSRRATVHGPNARPKLEVEAPHEPRSQSGAKADRTPNAIAHSLQPSAARCVWSAVGFSAALVWKDSPRQVQVFKARIGSANSLPGPLPSDGGEEVSVVAARSCCVQPDASAVGLPALAGNELAAAGRGFAAGQARQRRQEKKQQNDFDMAAI